MSSKAKDVTTTTLAILDDGVKKWGNDKALFWISGLLGTLILVWAGLTATLTLKFEEKILSLIPGVLGTMVLVSLFVERVIEVFILVWRDRQSAIHEQNRDYWQTRQAQLKQDIQGLITERDGTPAPDQTRKNEIDNLLKEKRTAIDEATNNADIEEKALLPFLVRTRKVSTWIGLVIGIFTSAVGFRFLSQIVILEDPFKTTNQYHLFVVADVLLTGTVLAGGSKLIHRIFSVYESFMQSAQKSLSDKNKT